MDLLDVYSKTTGSVQSPWTHVTLEMLGLLVLHQNYIGSQRCVECECEQ